MRISLFIFYGLMIWSYGLNGVSRIWDAEAYLETSKYAKSLALEIIDQIAWSGKESVLDVGTGDGLNSSLIASKVPLGNVLGIDPSREMIDSILSNRAGISRPRKITSSTSWMRALPLCASRIK